MILSSRWKTHSRVEKPATDSVKRPSIDEQREAVNKGDEHDCLAAGTSAGPGWGRSLGESHQLSAIAEPEEEERPHELARGRDKVATQDADVPTLDMRLAPGAVYPAVFCFGRHCQRGLLLRIWNPQLESVPRQ